MREILFRGRRISDGSWVEGGIIKTFHPNFDHESPEAFKFRKANCYCICANNIVEIEHTIRTYSWDEIPDTYKPRRSHSCWWDEERDEMHYKRNYVAEYKGKEARWILRNGSDQHKLRESFLHFHNGIIIGNIHDNPELLKGGAEG